MLQDLEQYVAVGCSRTPVEGIQLIGHLRHRSLRRPTGGTHEFRVGAIPFPELPQQAIALLGPGCRPDEVARVERLDRIQRFPDRIQVDAVHAHTTGGRTVGVESTQPFGQGFEFAVCPDPAGPAVDRLQCGARRRRGVRRVADIAIQRQQAHPFTLDREHRKALLGNQAPGHPVTPGIELVRPVRGLAEQYQARVGGRFEQGGEIPRIAQRPGDLRQHLDQFTGFGDAADGDASRSTSAIVAPTRIPRRGVRTTLAPRPARGAESAAASGLRYDNRPCHRRSRNR